MNAKLVLENVDHQTLLCNTLAAVGLGFHAGNILHLDKISQDESVIREWSAAKELAGISTDRFGESEQLAIMYYRPAAAFGDGGEVLPLGNERYRRMKADGMLPRTLEILSGDLVYLIYRSSRVIRQGSIEGEIFLFARGLIDPQFISGYRDIAEAPEWMLEGSTEPEAPQTFRFKPTPIDSLISAKPPAWQIRDILPAEGLAVMFGEPGSGKSFLALDMLAAIARGEPWGGQRTKKGVAVYVGLEAKVNDRVAAYLQHHELKPADLAGKLHVFQGQPLDMSNQRSVDTFVADLTVQGIEPSIVVFDTLARSLPGKDENSSTDMSALIACAGRISNALGCLVIMVHHSGKDASRGARGHSSLLGAADAELAVTYDRVTGTRQVSATKMKDGADGVAWQFQLSTVDLPAFSSDPDEGPRSSLVVSQVVRSIGGTNAKRNGKTEWTPPRLLVHQAFANAASAKGGAFDAPHECSHEEWAVAHEELHPLREGLQGKELSAAKKVRALEFKRGVDWLVSKHMATFDPKRKIYTASTAR
ncbi:MAG: AAA family ATPase [Pseudoxanthomonas sp.]